MQWNSIWPLKRKNAATCIGLENTKLSEVSQIGKAAYSTVSLLDV